MGDEQLVTEPVVDWLLGDGSDPAIRWQVQRDVLGLPAATWEAERARIATEGWGARLLELQDDDGQWAGGAFFPADLDRDEEGQPWTATSWVLDDLRRFGLDPSIPQMRRTVECLGANATWEHDAQPFWEGEVEPCINGRTVAHGAWLGVDMTPLVDRLVGEQLDDGGWNCEAEVGSVRSSFDTTINVVEGLLAHEQATGGTDASIEARRAGEEYLLQRRLFRRLSTGVPIDTYLTILEPPRWHHDVLRGLDHLRRATAVGEPPDWRLAEAVAFVTSRRRSDGRWEIDGRPAGRVWFHTDAGEGQPSRWATLRALRVLRWWQEGTA